MYFHCQAAPHNTGPCCWSEHHPPYLALHWLGGKHIASSLGKLLRKLLWKSLLLDKYPSEAAELHTGICLSLYKTMFQSAWTTSPIHQKYKCFLLLHILVTTWYCQGFLYPIIWTNVQWFPMVYFTSHQWLIMFNKFSCD